MKTIEKLIVVFSISVVALGLEGCQNTDQPREKTPPNDSLSTDSIHAVSQPLTLPFQTIYNEETDQFEIKKNTDSNHIAHTPEDLAKALNSKYPEIKIVVKEKIKDTLVVSIPDATSLTQTSGTTGAMAYLAEATYAFTSLDSIQVVNFSFKEGDHAIPGPYTRNSFKEFLK